ncbi:putative F-box/FBD/LRR-repeat protein At1g22000 [Capsella rubella]|uniref:putative F-box/FBD/LRR-repeat protein At1g22000 n=1 Tax=Capsella rubella TaxID=81985 RepID=UPI000CD4C7C5|nr:putative F-box/FBD/LRR-repeat protein At1g22000 [Capsella rubella]
MILSKRWLSIWTMIPTLVYKDSNDINDGEQKSVWQFLDKSLKQHKAPVLERIVVQLGQQCPVDEDVGKWIANAIDRKVRILSFELNWSAKPIKVPTRLYTCDTLVRLNLTNKILVDVASPACLPSLTWLSLNSVVYEDEDSLVGLLSSCPILKILVVRRHIEDNVTNFKVKVSSLESLTYDNLNAYGRADIKGSLVIDSPALKKISIWDSMRESCSIENTPLLSKACILVMCYSGDKFMLSSLISLDIFMTVPTVKFCTTTNFSQLVECRIQPYDCDWLEPLMALLQNSPKLKLLLIDQSLSMIKDWPLSWNRPCSVPTCMLSHLEIFEWKEYGGGGEEKELVRYILGNSKYLKIVSISVNSTCNLEDKEKMIDELKSMPMMSQSSDLMFKTRILQDNYDVQIFDFISIVI